MIYTRMTGTTSISFLYATLSEGSCMSLGININYAHTTAFAPFAPLTSGISCRYHTLTWLLNNFRFVILPYIKLVGFCFWSLCFLPCSCRYLHTPCFGNTSYLRYPSAFTNSKFFSFIVSFGFMPIANDLVLFIFLTNDSKFCTQIVDIFLGSWSS